MNDSFNIKNTKHVRATRFGLIVHKQNANTKNVQVFGEIEVNCYSDHTIRIYLN